MFHSPLKSNTLMLVVELALKGRTNHKTTTTEQEEQINPDNGNNENETNEGNFEEKSNVPDETVENKTNKSSQICMSVGWCVAPCSNKQHTSRSAPKKNLNKYKL